MLTFSFTIPEIFIFLISGLVCPKFTNVNNSTSNVNEFLRLIDAYAHKIAELSKEQEKLYDELLIYINSSDQYLLDAVFEFCYNGGVQAGNHLEKQITRLDSDE